MKRAFGRPTPLYLMDDRLFQVALAFPLRTLPGYDKCWQASPGRSQAPPENAARMPMDVDDQKIPGVTDDPVLVLILTGKARNLDEAEEMYLDGSLPQILELLGQPLPDDELARHPLLTLLRVRGSRGREDSLL